MRLLLASLTPMKYKALFSRPPAMPTFYVRVKTFLILERYSGKIVFKPSLKGITIKRLEVQSKDFYSITSR